MMHEEGSFKGTGGLKIYWQAWVPDDVRAAIAIAHGYGEHSGRYAHLSGFLSEKGFACFALDHRGHGRSEGKRGHIDSFSEFLDDMDTFWKMISERYADKKKFALGHSMGGLIATLWAMRRPEGLDGLVVSSAAYTLKIDANPIKLALGRLFLKIAPSVTLGSGLDANLVSRDPEVVKAYIADSMVHDRISARMFDELVNATEECKAKSAELKVPILIMQSGADGLVEPKGSEEIYNKASSEDKTLKIWDGFFHEMFNEPEEERKKAYNFTLEWLEKHLILDQ